MEKLCLSKALNHLKKNAWLLFSAVAALCLLVAPSLISLALIAAAFGAVVTAAAFDVIKPESASGRYRKRLVRLVTVLVASLGFVTFYTTWAPSGKLSALAASFGLTGPAVLILVGLLGCAVGWYAIGVLSRWIVFWSGKILDTLLPLEQGADVMANLKRNWFFPISAMAYFCLNGSMTEESAFGILISVFVAVVVCARVPSVWTAVKTCGRSLCLFSCVSAAGVCLTLQGSFAAKLARFSIPGMVSILFAAAAVFFVYCCILLFWKCMIGIFRKYGIFREIRSREWLIYGILLTVCIVFMVLSFTRTDAFYGTEFPYDIIYTSDSPKLVKGNVYISLTHTENDLRQPLFAVFAAPFTGIAYLTAWVLGDSSVIQAILVNSMQIALLFAANLMVSRMMKLDSRKRICFMILTCCTYTQLLFILMMEQYIVAYFWLVFCICLIAEKGRTERLALWGAGGTLLTTMVLLPFLSDKHPIREFKAWFMDMVKYGLEFVVLMLVCCRFDVIYNLFSKITLFSSFSGESLTWMDKICQYTTFIINCFAAPAAGANTTFCDYVSWQLEIPSGPNVAGIAVLLLAVVSAIWNRDKMSSRLAALWVGFSFVMLLGLGWGTAENGLILYALYFGWAYLVLLFQLVETVGNRLRIRLLVPVVSILVSVLLLAVNIPAMMELLTFAVTYYPV